MTVLKIIRIVESTTQEERAFREQNFVFRVVNIYYENVKAFQNYGVIRKNNGYRKRLFSYKQEIFVTGNNMKTDEELFITRELELNSDNEENIINKRPRPGQKRKRLLLTNKTSIEQFGKKYVEVPNLAEYQFKIFLEICQIILYTFSNKLTIIYIIIIIKTINFNRQSF